MQPALRRALLLAPFLLLAAMSAATWRHWGDPLIDMGRELSVPSRLAAGQRLYLEVRSPYGPLGSWTAAAIFGIFGSHARTLIAASLALSALGLLALVRIAERLAGTAAAALAGCLVAGMPFFLPYGGCVPLPYSFAALLGVALAWWSLDVALAASPILPWRAAAAGLLAGLAVSSKIDAGAPAVLGIGVGIALAGGPLRSRAVALAAFAGAAAAVVVPLHAIASIGIPFESLRREGYLIVLSVAPEWRTLYAKLSGFDSPARHLFELAELAVVSIPAIGLAAFVVAAVSRRSSRAAAVTAIAFAALATAAGSWALRSRAPLPAALADLPPVLKLVPPLALLLAAVALGAALARREPPLPVALALAAAAATGRVFLNARYSSPYATFGLPLALLAVVVLATRTLPGLAAARQPEAVRPLALLGGGLVAAWLAVHLDWKLHWFHTPGRFGEVRTAEGPFFVTPRRRAESIQALHDLLSREVSPGETFVVFTEGTFLNFVLGRTSPIPHEQILPGNLDARGEAELVRHLEAAPPELAVVVDTDFEVWGTGRFGVDFDTTLGAYLSTRYRPFALIPGGESAPGRSVGVPPIRILRRR